MEESERKLEKRRKREEELRQQLQQKEAERQDIEGKYTSLQEEAAAKTAKLKEIWKQFQAAKEEVINEPCGEGGALPVREGHFQGTAGIKDDANMMATVTFPTAVSPLGTHAYIYIPQASSHISKPLHHSKRDIVIL